MNIDIRTLGLVLVITHLIQLIVFLYQYIINKHYKGVGWWLLWSAAEVAGFLFLLLRDIPSIHIIAVILQNVLIISGVIFVYIGIMRFIDRTENRRIILAILILYIASFLYFLFINDDIQIRSFLISGTLAIVSFITAYSLIFYRPAYMTASANLTAVVFLAHGSFFTIRTAMLIIGTPQDTFQSTPLNIATYIDALFCSILWTFVFIVMINQRLNQEMKEAKEEMELVFNTSPDAAIISRLSDGLIIYANESFSILSGYTHNEAVGKSSLDINIWADPNDRLKIVSDLNKKGFIDNLETLFRTKDNRVLSGLMSVRIIYLQNIPHLISLTRDISDRKAKENELHDMVHKLQKALDEIKKLQGILPICASCKKIKDDKGYWQQVENYIASHSEAEFSHLICPDCMKKLYPEYSEEEKHVKQQ
jgi:PAS domain S-box-containing protein